MNPLHVAGLRSMQWDEDVFPDLEFVFWGSFGGEGEEGEGQVGGWLNLGRINLCSSPV